LSTLLQVWLGHRMAMVSGPNVIPSLAIVAAITAGGVDYAQQAFLAQAIASVIVIALTLLGVVKYIKKVWSPLILRAMVMLVSLSISKQGITLLATSGFGWPFFAGVVLALLATFMAIRAKGVWGTLPPLVIIVLGYVVFMLAGAFEWELVGKSDLFVWPNILPYGLQMPPLDLIAIMVVVNLMAMLNLFGNLDGYAHVIRHKLTDKMVNRSFFFLWSG